MSDHPHDLPSRLADLERRVADLEARLPSTGLLERSFVRRALAVAGHNLAVAAVLGIPAVALLLVVVYLVLSADAP